MATEAIETSRTSPPVDEPTETPSQALTTRNDTDEIVQIITREDGKKVKRIIRKKKRPARAQVDPSTFKSEAPAQTGTIFNIWYNKWSGGDREDKYASKTHAKGRCNVAKDSGYTRADGVVGSYFCLFFARGLCPKGRDCEYLHRLPNTFDIYSGNMDCFGREKHSDYRDDMGGVGTFSRQNRTLYIGRIHPTDDIEEIVARHFAEWGNIERIRVLPTRGVAFVTYATEALAQFAKEAMAHQSLDNEEVLNVRWATVDPNPASQKREARAIEQQAADAIRKALPQEFIAQIEGERGAKRPRLENGQALRQIEGQGRDGQHALQAPDERLLLEAADAEEAQTAEEDVVAASDEQASKPQSGLFSSSTLSALQNYRPGGAVAASAPAAKAKGPLVGYGSDDDEDDSD